MTAHIVEPNEIWRFEVDNFIFEITSEDIHYKFSVFYFFLIFPDDQRDTL